LPADLLHQGRVVVGLARPLRKRGGTQEDDRRATQRAEAQHHYRTIRSQDAI
jgi:hypothetical protein